MSITPLRIKVCGMRDPENIAEVIRLQPDFIGFILFSESKRYVGDDYSLPVNVPQSVKKVGVFVNATMPEVFAWKNRLTLDYVQLHGEESPEYCMELQKMKIKVIKAFNIDPDFNFSLLERYNPWCVYFLFDTKTDLRGGSGGKFDWKILKKYPYIKPFFLSGGIGPKDAKEILKINNLPMEAVDINSCFEDSPARKNIEKLQFFFNEINASK